MVVPLLCWLTSLQTRTHPINSMKSQSPQFILPGSRTNQNTLSSNLLTHVYQYFGEFYGCSEQGSGDFPKYKGVASMYEVHKYVTCTMSHSQAVHPNLLSGS
jgi:hypothetical protein